MDERVAPAANVSANLATRTPRNNRRRIGRIVIAHGRDAADVAMVTSFSPHILNRFHVWTDEVPD